MTAGFNICLDVAALREDALIELSKAQRLPMKPTCGPDDGSNAGPWITEPAHEIDGADKRVLRAAVAVALGQGAV